MSEEKIRMLLLMGLLWTWHSKPGVAALSNQINHSHVITWRILRTDKWSGLFIVVLIGLKPKGSC